MEGLIGVTLSTLGRWSVVVPLLLALTTVVPQSAGAQGTPPRSRSISLERFESRSASRSVRLLTAGVSVGAQLTPTLSGEIQPKVALVTGRWVFADAETPGIDAEGAGAGASGLLRWSPVRIAFFEPYVDGSFGFLLMSDELPPTGTTWNFWTRWGAGMSVRPGRDVGVRVGLRWIHVSNGGKLTGQRHNPGYDGQGLVIAVQFGR